MENESSSPLGQVLVVDDESALVPIVCEMVTNMGYEATGLVSGKEALDAIREHDFDILLTDIIMPDMNGIELLQAASQSDPYLVGILMTGQATVRTAVEAIKVGAFDYIEKPFTTDTLSSVLSRAMEIRRLKVENIQLHETIRIHELAKTVAAAFDVETILNKLADAAQGLVEADEVSIMLRVDENESELCIAVVRGVDLMPYVGTSVSIRKGVAGWVAANLEPLILNGAIEDNRFQSIYFRNEIYSSVSMPILSGGKFLGVLNVKTTRSRTFFMPGQIKGLTILVGLVAPVLERARLYRQIHQAETKYRDIFDNAVEGMYQAIPAKLYITANKAFAHIYGYVSPEELISGVRDIELEQYVNPSFYRDFTDILMKHGSISNYEAQHYRKDRSIIWVALNARAIYSDNGELLYYEGSCEDITARKNVEGALKRERFTLEQFIDNLPLLAYGISPEGKIINCNNVALKMLGYESKDELIGRSASILYAPESRDDVLKMMKLWEVKGVLKNEEFKLITKDGRILDVLLNVHTILRKNNIPLYFIVTQMDITDRKRMEEELKKAVQKLKKATGGIIEALVTSVEARDPYTSGHQRRVADLATAMARVMDLSPKLIDGIQMSGLIHDLGKISIPAEILSRPRSLTTLEYNLVRTHPTVGHDILKDIDFTWPIAQIVLQHHERLDGSGYPQGLRGDEILLEAQIMAIADTVEAMASHRPYRVALGIDKALEEIDKNKGILYNTEAVNACLSLFREGHFEFG